MKCCLAIAVPIRTEEVELADTIGINLIFRADVRRVEIQPIREQRMGSVCNDGRRGVRWSNCLLGVIGPV